MLTSPLLLAGVLSALGLAAGTPTQTIDSRQLSGSNNNNKRLAAPLRRGVPAPSFPNAPLKQATRAQIVRRDAYFQKYGARKRQTSSTSYATCPDSADSSSTISAAEYQGYTASYSTGTIVESTHTYSTSTECGSACMNDGSCNYANYEVSTGTCTWYDDMGPDTLTATSGYITYVYVDYEDSTACSHAASDEGFTTETCCNFFYDFD